jgi:hypothetical protein
MFIEEYTDCFSDKLTFIQGRTSNLTYVDGISCKSFTDCTRKLCFMGNDSRVDWLCILNDQGNINIINYYNTNSFYVLLIIIIFLLLLSLSLSVLTCHHKRKINMLESIGYEKMMNIKTEKYGIELDDK